MTRTWTSQELDEAFQLHATTVAAAAKSADWEPFVQLFLPDATYVDPIEGTLRGQEEIRRWATRTLGTFPGSAMHFPAAWHLVDVERGRIVCELRNVLRDPGDGSVFEENNITVLDYAGNGRFRSERDVYDSPAMSRVIEAWGRRCAQLGSLSAGEREWFAAAYPQVLQPAP